MAAIQLPYYLSLPSAEPPFPGVLVVHEGNGMSPQLLRVCERLAAEGYAACAPDFFFRSGGPEAAGFAELIGASDFPSLWNQAPREGLQLHWDGDNDSVDERNLSAALGAGVTPVTVDHASIKRIRDWIWTLPPPEYPYPVDRDLAARGAEVYRQHCVNCHAGAGFRKGTRDAGRVGFVVPIDEIGTDPHRLNSYTEAFAGNQYSLYPESPYRFTHFRKTNGYATHPLDGIWLRGPYLHNGSVPTLRNLLEAPERRPKMFYRGYDVFDQRNVGFISSVASEGSSSPR